MNPYLKPGVLDDTDPSLFADLAAAEGLADAIHAPRTEYSYHRIKVRYEQWCAQLPCDPATPASLVAYLRELKDRAPSTINTVIAALRHAYPQCLEGAAGVQVRRVLTAHNRRHGGKQPDPDKTARPLSPTEAAAVCRAGLMWNNVEGLELRMIAAVLWDTARRWNHLDRLQRHAVNPAADGYALTWAETKTGGDRTHLPHTCNDATAPYITYGPIDNQLAAAIGMTIPRANREIRAGTIFPATPGNDPTQVVHVTRKSVQTPATVCPACAVDDWMTFGPATSRRFLHTRTLSAVNRRIRRALIEEGCDPTRASSHSFKKGHSTFRSVNGEPLLLIAEEANTSPSIIASHYTVIDPFHTAQVGTPAKPD